MPRHFPKKSITSSSGQCEAGILLPIGSTSAEPWQMLAKTTLHLHISKTCSGHMGLLNGLHSIHVFVKECTHMDPYIDWWFMHVYNTYKHGKSLGDGFLFYKDYTLCYTTWDQPMTSLAVKAAPWQPGRNLEIAGRKSHVQCVQSQLWARASRLFQ